MAGFRKSSLCSRLQPLVPSFRARYVPAELQEEVTSPRGDPGTKTDKWTILKNEVLEQPGFSNLCYANICLYALRSGLQAWTVFFLMRPGSPLTLAQALSLFSTLELGGLCGSVAGGVLSDALIARRAATSPAVLGCRVQVALASLVVLVLSLVGLLWLPLEHVGSLTAALLLFSIGFSLYGPQGLIGLCGMEAVPSSAAGVSQGALGIAAYGGASLAGLPLGWLLQSRVGWNGWRVALLLLSSGIILVLMPLCRTKSFQQRLRCK
eukprot:TRINITY_DN33285_c1_g1_i4.p1 TRINITY_DN33285_c1_g1~~TRINITY_DN33285_c1_g1_i4.p1  ORF type:complete len:266 (-),score=16.44 TRINITY_DN33285_c1_g1_i4:27-824(-)